MWLYRGGVGSVWLTCVSKHKASLSNGQQWMKIDKSFLPIQSDLGIHFVYTIPLLQNCGSAIELFTYLLLSAPTPFARISSREMFRGNCSFHLNLCSFDTATSFAAIFVNIQRQYDIRVTFLASALAQLQNTTRSNIYAVLEAQPGLQRLYWRWGGLRCGKVEELGDANPWNSCQPRVVAFYEFRGKRLKYMTAFMPLT